MVIDNSDNDGSFGKPDAKYIEFFFTEFAHYTKTVRKNNSGRIDAATVALIIICPDSAMREQLLEEYSKEKENLGILTASSIVSGKMMSYLSNTLGFTENAMGGFL